MTSAHANAQTAGEAWRDITYTVRDGLRLYARHYRAAAITHHRAAVCLPDIVHNSQDCHDLAVALSRAGAQSRDVYTIDYRGRGRSEYDSDWRNYSPFLEMLDVLDFFAVQRLHDAALIGTGRGGIIAMIMAAVRPAAIGAVVLNDIGPQIEATGWIRQMGRVGRTPIPASWQEAARYVRELEGDCYPRFGEAQWARLARQRYFDANGRPAATYDNQISRTFSLNAIADGVPSMWPQFKALGRVPTLVVRGELSDVLSAATVAEMERTHPRLRALTVPQQGHAPLLGDEASIGIVKTFLAEARGGERQPTTASAVSVAGAVEPRSAPVAVDRLPLAQRLARAASG